MLNPTVPVPWLLNMQRFGPPPSYPYLRIPGLNAPIPEGAQWGYHPGGWGKPPVDEYNRPLYGDVFGLYTQYQKQLQSSIDASHLTTPPNREVWGQLQQLVEPMEEEEEEEAEVMEEESGGEEEGGGEAVDTTTPSIEIHGLRDDGLATPSGFTSVATGIVTPAVIQLRKETTNSASMISHQQQRQQQQQQQGEEDESRQQEKARLYKLIPQKANKISGMMGSQHVYDLTKTKVSDDAPFIAPTQLPQQRKRRMFGDQPQQDEPTSSSADFELSKNSNNSSGSGIQSTASTLSTSLMQSDDGISTETKLAKRRKYEEARKKQRDFKF
jgi:splicing factor 3B subunit 2